MKVSLEPPPPWKLSLPAPPSKETARPKAPSIESLPEPPATISIPLTASTLAPMLTLPVARLTTMSCVTLP